MNYKLISLMIAGALGVTGCGTNSMSGTIRYDGELVETGVINLLPVDGKGAIAGGTISKGEYRIDNIPPGLKTVEITGRNAIEFATSSADLQRMAESGEKPPEVKAIPRDAKGNNQSLEITNGHVVRDFELLPP